MAQVITFESYTPSPRYDSLPWTEVGIEEAVASDGPWVELERQALSPVDADPTNPAARNFTTELASDDPDLWYRVVFYDATGDESQPTVAVQNTTPATGTPYASVTELARILKLRDPTAAQTTAMNRVLLAAAGEIDSEIGRSDLSGWELSLAAQVNLDRAADLWRHTESVPGLVGIPDEAMPTTFGRYSWERYAQRLAPIKQEWGLA